MKDEHGTIADGRGKPGGESLPRLGDYPIVDLGATADIRVWAPGRLVKVFYAGRESGLDYELDISRAVHEAGLPAPAIYGSVTFAEGRRGIIMERIEGTSMLAEIESRPVSLFRHARTWAELAARLHEAKVAVDLPSQRERVARKLQRATVLPTEWRAPVEEMLAGLPGGDVVCHGDLHPDNILLDGEEAVIIDWMDATRGCAEADLARSWMLMVAPFPEGHEVYELPNWLRKWGAKAMGWTFLRRYRHLRNVDWDLYGRWKTVLAAMRLAEGYEYEHEWLLAQVEQGLAGV